MSAQVKQGYKLTEVGEIPVEWCVATLGEICMFENGDRGSNYPSPNSFVTSGVPFINAGHIANGKINFGDMNYITPESFNRLGSGKVRRGDILFCLRGSIGKFGIAGDSLGDGAIASSLVIIRPKTTSINLEYLSCYFSSELCSRMIDTWSGGAAQPNLGAQDLAKFSVPLPARQAEQRAIAATLSDMDALISGLDHLIAKKRDIKQAAMQQLLTGQQRLPGFSEKWEVNRLGDVFDIFAGGDFEPSSSSVIQDEKYPFPIYSNSLTDAGLYGFCSYSIYPKDSITVTARGSIGFANYRDTPYTAIGRVLVLLPKREVNCQFYAEFINNKISFVVESTGVPQLTAPQISKYEIPMPSFAEQVAIAIILSDMNNEIVILETRRDKARQLKQGMMQELLTGRTRLA
ncbi:restriction endonuclease subunit S [Pseudomonas lundensis]|uniref:restriction endonuclease subunit S n=1 Tax=Pseudomonas lundensis TaxID=86185 RepID=UPI000641BB1A|nr:restriction endonuclease subunit S [Pseudomonas lundensis]